MYPWTAQFLCLTCAMRYKLIFLSLEANSHLSISGINREKVCSLQTGSDPKSINFNGNIPTDLYRSWIRPRKKWSMKILEALGFCVLFTGRAVLEIIQNTIKPAVRSI